MQKWCGIKKKEEKEEKLPQWGKKLHLLFQLFLIRILILHFPFSCVLFFFVIILNSTTVESLKENSFLFLLW